ncbi:hypothetical protein AAF712_012967 [Marasmius tenuissimus]|uniref:Uncharacterized protein n=1 Tax=Marasmius tenuissimus TaxID=585030 RepID=A0ABR2ZF37_9AGAR
MKAIALGVISFVPLTARAAVITLVDFGEFSPPGTSTLSEAFAVPIGTNGAETKYVLNDGGGTETGAGDGGLVTFTHTPSAIFLIIVSAGYLETFVASASGYKGGGEATGIDGLVHTADTECRYTGKDVGECVITVDAGATDATTVTVTDPATAFLVVTVSEASGTTPTGGRAAPTTGRNGNNTSSGDQKDRDGAMGLSTGKQLILTAGGLVLGALANF